MLGKLWMLLSIYFLLGCTSQVAEWVNYERKGSEREWDERWTELEFWVVYLLQRKLIKCDLAERRTASWVGNECGANWAKNESVHNQFFHAVGFLLLLMLLSLQFAQYFLRNKLILRAKWMLWWVWVLCNKMSVLIKFRRESQPGQGIYHERRYLYISV